MSQDLTPSPPRISLKQATGLARKIYTTHRTSGIDREDAARSMGYAGLTRRALGVLSDLAQFELLSSSAGGKLKLTDTALVALNSENEEKRRDALYKAARSPTSFSLLSKHYPAGPPTAKVAQSFLLSKGIGPSSAGNVAAAYYETMDYLTELFAKHLAGADNSEAIESKALEDYQTPPTGQEQWSSAGSERVIFREEFGKGRHVKLSASGEIDEALLKSLEDYIRRQRERMAGD